MLTLLVSTTVIRRCHSVDCHHWHGGRHSWSHSEDLHAAHGEPKCYYSLYSRYCVAVLQWFNGSMPDCGVSGPRFESHCRQLFFSRQSLQYTALGMGCTPLLQSLGRLSLPPFVGRYNEYQLLGWVIIKWRWWMWTVAAISFWRTCSPSQLAWSEGWRPPRRWVCIHQMNWVNSLNGFVMMTAP